MHERHFGAMNQSRATGSAAPLVRDWLRFALTAALERVLIWHQRSVARHRLRGLNDHMLKDIGISRAEIEAECRKPFWKV